MVFLNLKIFYLLLLFPVVLIGGYFIFKIYNENKNFSKTTLSKMRNYNYSNFLFSLKIFFLSLSFILLIIVFLRPAWGKKENQAEANGSDVVFTLDVSQSMKALDMGKSKRGIDRLSAAKDMISTFVSNHSQNRYGLVIFAGEAFVSTPLTMDHNAFLTFLDGVDYNDVGEQGTNLDEALKSSIARFINNDEKDRGRLIVLLSDGGEDLGDKSSIILNRIKEEKISIFAVGLGSIKGVPIPESTDFFGHTNYKQYQGKTVLTKLNEKTLKTIAKESNGEYFHAKNSNDLEKINNKLSSLKTTSIKEDLKGLREDKFQIFLLPSLILFLLYLFLPNEVPDNISGIVYRQKSIFLERKCAFKDRIKQIRKLFLFIGIIFLLSGCTPNQTLSKYYLKHGNEKYAKSYYSEALEQYDRAEKDDKIKYLAQNNKALSWYKTADYENAKKELEAAEKKCRETEEDFCDQVYYNLGNVYYRIGEKKTGEEQIKIWQQAIESYKSDLSINKNDKEAQENIDFIIKKIQSGDESEQKNNEDGKQKGNEKKTGGNDIDKKESAGSEKQSGGKKNQTEGKQNNNNDNSKKGDNSKNSAEGDEQSSGDKAEQGNSTNSQRDLDKKTDQQIEEYLKQLEQQESQNQNGFRPNPNSRQNSGDPFDNFFNNDPFFKDFFNNSFKGQFKNNQKDGSVDW